MVLRPERRTALTPAAPARARATDEATALPFPIWTGRVEPQARGLSPDQWQSLRTAKMTAQANGLQGLSCQAHEGLTSSRAFMASTAMQLRLSAGESREPSQGAESTVRPKDAFMYRMVRHVIGRHGNGSHSGQK